MAREQRRRQALRVLNRNAAGIDIGSNEHWVAVPPDRDPEPVRRFAAFTADLVALADWLRQCGVTSVVMEATGVYWIPLFQILETRGFEVKLVNAKHVRHVPGRKSDQRDCQWLQELHSYGLLSASFRPENDICVLRAYLRHRDNVIRAAAQQVQLMQKSLIQMNVLLHNVISDRCWPPTGTRAFEPRRRRSRGRCTGTIEKSTCSRYVRQWSPMTSSAGNFGNATRAS